MNGAVQEQDCFTASSLEQSNYTQIQHQKEFHLDLIMVVIMYVWRSTSTAKYSSPQRFSRAGLFFE